MAFVNPGQKTAYTHKALVMSRNRVSRSGLKCIRKFDFCLYRTSVIKAQKRAKDTAMQRGTDSTFSYLDHQNLLFWN